MRIIDVKTACFYIILLNAIDYFIIKQTRKMKNKLILLTGLIIFGFGLVNSQEIIHDAEQAILVEQYGEKWAKQDKEIQKKT